MTAKTRLQIDLAELASEPAILTLPDGTEVEVQPPELGDFLGIAKLSDALDDASGEGKPEEILGAFVELKSELVKLIPELKAFKLNLPQTQALIEGLNQLTIPSDLKELAEKNIRPVTQGKKARSTSSKK